MDVPTKRRVQYVISFGHPGSGVGIIGVVVSSNVQKDPPLSFLSRPPTAPCYSEPKEASRTMLLMRAFALLAWPMVWVAAHPHCWTDERSVDLDDVLDYCSTNDDASYGVCCTDAEEEALAERVGAAVSTLTADCAALHKQVCMRNERCRGGKARSC